MHTNSNLEPYPSREPIADAPVVVEPITLFAERVWHGPRSFDFHVRPTPAFVARESERLSRAWSFRTAAPGPIGSRFD